MSKIFNLVATTFNLRRGNLSPEVKIVIIGQASVGKTALILQYISGKFIEDYTPQCATLYDHSIQMDNTNVGVRIWDTAGQFEMETRAHQLEVYIRWADVVLMMYAVTDPASFMLAKHLLQEIQKLRPLCNPFINRRGSCASTESTNNGSKNNSPKGVNGHENNRKTTNKCCDSCQDLPILVIATKVDLIQKRRITEEHGISLCVKNGCVSYREVSVKDSQNDDKSVKGIFEEAVRRGWLYRQHCVLSRNKYLSLSQQISRNRNLQIQVPHNFPSNPIIIHQSPSFEGDPESGSKDEESKEEADESGDLRGEESFSPKRKLQRRKSFVDWIRRLKIKNPEEEANEHIEQGANEEENEAPNRVRNKNRRASLGQFLSYK